MASGSQIFLFAAVFLLLGLNWLAGHYWSVVVPVPMVAAISQEHNSAPASLSSPLITHQFLTQPIPGNLSRYYESLVQQVLAWLPAAHAQAVREITIVYDPTGPRGLGGGRRVIINAAVRGAVTGEVAVPTAEFMAVLVHEIGHVVDTGLLSGDQNQGESPFHDGPFPVYRDDRSLSFYTFSWEAEKTLRAGAHYQDFVSGYGQADVFEDFAESYLYYVLHGKNFRALTLANEVLRQKYLYLRDQIFAGQEYDSGSLAGFQTETRGYDATLLPLAGEPVALVDR